MKENQITLTDDGRKLEGYIARFDAPYFDGSKHRAEMYETALKEFDEKEIRIPLLWLHSSQDGRPVGSMLSWSMDDKGIWAVFQLSDTTFVKEEVIPSILSGAVTHFSTEESEGEERVIVAVALVPIGNAITARIEKLNEIKTEGQEKPESLLQFMKAKRLW